MPAVFPKNGARSVLVVPWWSHPASDNEIISLESIDRFSTGIDLVIVAPDKLCVPPILHPDRVEVFPACYFTDVWAYSELLITEKFYSRFADYDQLLIVQSDVLLLKPLAALAGAHYPWSYVGAPWVAQAPSGGFRFTGVGNGGFSLRRTQETLAVLRGVTLPCLPRFTTPLKGLVYWLFLFCLYVVRANGERIAQILLRRKIVEDIFWAQVAPCLSSKFTVAPVRDALAFSYELFPRFSHQENGGRLPYGIHGWWRHDVEFVRELAALK